MDPVLEERIKNVLSRVEQLNGNVEKLVNTHTNTVKDIAVIKNDIENHNERDETNFSAIFKKHSLYDKFIVGVLIFASTELFSVVIYLTIHKS